MRPFFTIHAGEYLVGSHIEQTYPHWSVWVPSKDTGIDLLVTDSKNRKTVSLQVKFSKDFATYRSGFLQNKLIASGWWTHEEQKIHKSQADLWGFVLPSFVENETNFIVIPPDELLRRLRLIHRTPGKRINSYLWVTKTKPLRCWEARGLASADQKRIADGSFSNELRDFSGFLNDWHQVEERLK